MGDEFSDGGHGSQDGDQMTSQYHDGSILAAGAAGAGVVGGVYASNQHGENGSGENGAEAYGPRDSMTFGGSQIALSTGAGNAGYPLQDGYGQSGPGYYEDGGYVPPPPGSNAGNHYYGYENGTGYEGQQGYEGQGQQGAYEGQSEYGNGYESTQQHQEQSHYGDANHGQPPMHNPYA